MTIRLRNPFPLLLLCLVTLFPVLPGCQTKLDPGGVYQGNVAQFNAESTIKTEHDVVQAFLRFELNNRALLKVKAPDVTVAADSIRTQVKQWEQAAVEASNAYFSSPTQTNLDKLNAALNVLEVAAKQAAAFIASTKL